MLAQTAFIFSSFCRLLVSSCAFSFMGGLILPGAVLSNRMCKSFLQSFCTFRSRRWPGWAFSCAHDVLTDYTAHISDSDFLIWLPTGELMKCVAHLLFPYAIDQANATRHSLRTQDVSIGSALKLALKP